MRAKRPSLAEAEASLGAFVVAARWGSSSLSLLLFLRLVRIGVEDRFRRGYVDWRGVLRYCDCRRVRALNDERETVMFIMDLMFRAW